MPKPSKESVKQPPNSAALEPEAHVAAQPSFYLAPDQTSPQGTPSSPTPRPLWPTTLRRFKNVSIIVAVVIPVCGLMVATMSVILMFNKQNQDFRLLLEQEKTKQAEISRDESKHREAEKKLDAQRLDTEGRLRLDTEKEITYRTQLQSTLLNTQRQQEQSAQLGLAKERVREQEILTNHSESELRLAELRAKDQLSQERLLLQQQEQRKGDFERERNSEITAAVAKAVTAALDDKSPSEGALANLVGYYQYPEHRRAILGAAAVKVHRVRTLGEAQLLVDILKGGAPETFDLACAANISSKNVLEEAIFWKFISQYLKAAPTVRPEQVLSLYFSNNGSAHPIFPQYFRPIVEQKVNGLRAIYADRKWSDRLSIAGIAPPYSWYLTTVAGPVINPALQLVPVPGLGRAIYGPGIRFSRKRFEADLKQFTALNPKLIDDQSVEAQLYLLAESANIVRKIQGGSSKPCNDLLIPF